MTVLISVLSLAALVLAISCTVLFAIAAAIELLPERTGSARDSEGREQEISFAANERRMTPARVQSTRASSS